MNTRNRITHRGLNLFLITLLIAFSFSLSGCGDGAKYREAKKAMTNNDYEKAFNLLEQIPDYPDKKGIRNEAIYYYAETLYSIQNYERASELFERIPDYQDAAKRAIATKEAWAAKATKMGQYDLALKILEELGKKDQAVGTMLQKADVLINQGKYQEALDTIKEINDNETADDLKKAAEKGTFYLQAMASMDTNDFSTARKVVEAAVKIEHEKPIVLEDSYLKQYCASLHPVVSRLGSENKYNEVLKAIYPVWHMIREIKSEPCENVIKVLEVSADRYFFGETQRADWHQKINQYRTTYQDITARCNIYGGLMQQHLSRTKRMVNVAKAFEKIGSECNESNAINWKEAVSSFDLAMSRLILDWTKSKSHKKVNILANYVSSKLNDIEGITTRGKVKEPPDMKPEYRFNATALTKKNKFMVGGWVKNPSRYRPLHVKGVSLDCTNESTGNVVAKCGKVKFSEKVMPGKQQTMNAQVTVPSDTPKIIEYRLLYEFEDVKISSVKAEDVFKIEDKVIIIDNN